MKLKTIKDIKNLKGKRVLLRLDLNVPLEKGKVDKDGTWRLQRSVPTIKYLLAKKAKVIILAHLGRPGGKKISDLSMLPVSQALSKLAKEKIEFWADDFENYESDSLEMENASVAMLENIRFQPREKKNCKRLAKRLAKLGDIYVNDAFGNVHRQDSSMHAITEYLPSYAGLLLEDEIKHLSEVVKAKKGLIMMFGGVKVATKIQLIKKLSTNADHILVGGPLANTFLKSYGYNVGKSLYDKDYLDFAKKILSNKIHLPVDLVVSTSMKSKKSRIIEVDEIEDDEMTLDIGPRTVEDYKRFLAKAKLIVWNGPLGYFENPLYIKASRDLLKFLAKAKAKVIIGGGETVELTRELKLQNKIDFVSTGGGAMMTFLQGTKMPVLERLRK
ncbi:phosphoglycerate kinase [Candidatus Parcubacteria bacterium]|jgi:3-phosphoglycerate kinase|nr:phosphoglycerate kinase [Candidatus Parcubacteria bacterium]